MIRKTLIDIIRLYQNYISPLLGQRCRFYPTCSEYAVSCLGTHRTNKAIVKILWRILRCQPWHSGGIDLP